MPAVVVGIFEFGKVADVSPVIVVYVPPAVFAVCHIIFPV